MVMMATKAHESSDGRPWMALKLNRTTLLGLCEVSFSINLP